MKNESLSVSIDDYNSFTLVVGAWVDDEWDNPDGPKGPDIISSFSKKLKVPITFRKTGNGRYELVFRNNQEMKTAVQAFHKSPYTVKNLTIAQGPFAAKAKKALGV